MRREFKAEHIKKVKNVFSILDTFDSIGIEFIFLSFRIYPVH